MPIMSYIGDKFNDSYKEGFLKRYVVFFTKYTDLTGVDGGVIGTTNLGTVTMQKNKEFSIEVPQAYLDVNPLTNGNTLYVAVSTSSEELNYSNNSSEYLIKSSTDEPLVLNQKEVEMNTSASEQIEIIYSSVTDVSENNIEWKSSDETIVKVADGKITAIGSGEATVKQQLTDIQ